MATNFEQLMNGDDGKPAEGAADPYAKHFEAAGITAEDTGGDEAKSGKEQSTGAKSGEEAPKPGSEAKAPDGKAGDSGAKDADGKPIPDSKGKKEEGKTGNAGDLTLQDGSVVKAGAERRYYEQYHTERQRSADLQNQLKQMTESRDTHRQRLNEVQQTVQSIQGADPALVAVGVRMAKDLQRDPVGTLKVMLAEAVAAGYPIEGIGAGVDKMALERIVAQAALQNTQQPDQSQQIDQEVAQEINQFYSSYPDARIHDAVLGAVLRDHPQLTLTEAYFELKQQFIAKGFDWSKPLAEQATARSADHNKSPQAPMPNGRTATAMEAADKTIVAPANADSGDIVREAMREAGMNI